MSATGANSSHLSSPPWHRRQRTVKVALAAGWQVAHHAGCLLPCRQGCQVWDSDPHGEHPPTGLLIRRVYQFHQPDIRAVGAAAKPPPVQDTGRGRQGPPRPCLPLYSCGLPVLPFDTHAETAVSCSCKRG